MEKPGKLFYLLLFLMVFVGLSLFILAASLSYPGQKIDTYEGKLSLLKEKISPLQYANSSMLFSFSVVLGFIAPLLILIYRVKTEKNKLSKRTVITSILFGI